MKRIVLLLSLLVVMTMQIMAADAQTVLTDVQKDKDPLQ
jgi:hypothetical protein